MSRPARSWAPTTGEKTVAGERTPASDPANTVISNPARPAAGSSGWCSKAGATCRCGAGQGQPELDAVQPRVMLAGRFLGMGDPPPGGHQVELAGPDHLLTAQAVPVQHVPVQQPGDGLQADVRVRRHLHPGHAVHRHRAVVVHEAPGADAAPVPQRQQPADLDIPDPGHPPRGQLARGQVADGRLTWLAVRARRIRDGHIRVGSAHVPIVRRTFCPGSAGQPTSVLTAAVSSVSAPLASEKNMLVFGST